MPVPAGAAETKGVDIVALAANAHGELDRLDSAFLSDQPRSFFKLAAQLKRQFSGIAAPIKQSWRQWAPELAKLGPAACAPTVPSGTRAAV